MIEVTFKPYPDFYIRVIGLALIMIGAILIGTCFTGNLFVAVPFIIDEKYFPKTKALIEAHQ